MHFHITTAVIFPKRQTLKVNLEVHSVSYMCHVRSQPDLSPAHARVLHSLLTKCYIHNVLFNSTDQNLVMFLNNSENNISIGS